MPQPCRVLGRSGDTAVGGRRISGWRVVGAGLAWPHTVPTYEVGALHDAVERAGPWRPAAVLVPHDPTLVRQESRQWTFHAITPSARVTSASSTRSRRRSWPSSAT